MSSSKRARRRRRNHVRWKRERKSARLRSRVFIYERIRILRPPYTPSCAATVRRLKVKWLPFFVEVRRSDLVKVERLIGESLEERINKRWYAEMERRHLR